MTWQDLEQSVLRTATFIFDRPASPETINGVKLDCVVKLSNDNYVLIETTQSETLEKLRTDLAKFSVVRPYLFNKNIYAKCYFVTEHTPTESLRESGRGLNVEVLSITEFSRLYFDFATYHHARESRKFGSAVNPTSGLKDTNTYVPVKYIGVSQEHAYSLEDISNCLKAGKQIILIGNYGTGKSRCFQELFALLSESAHLYNTYPVAIDLRDNWGTKRANEVIQRHFDDLGLGHQASSIIKTIDKGAICLLLDGFDEIGSQTWSDNPIKLSQIRADSLLGVKDLIHRANGPLIVSGREHYFSSDDEMFKCLGLSPDSTIVIRCSDEFSEDEFESYLTSIYPKTIFPTWLPRRPLVCQVISEMGPDTPIQSSGSGSSETVFWRTFIQALCDREANIHQALDSFTIQKVLRHLARTTRQKPQNLGPLSIIEINKAFDQVTGLPPNDESAVMLQRLPGLGRIASESTDRYFVDDYILDGLRADDLQEIANLSDSSEICNQEWFNPLKRLGLTLLSFEISTSTNASGYHKLLRQAANRRNGVLAGDILAGLLLSTQMEIDFSGLTLFESHISFVNFNIVHVKNLTIRSSIIEEIDITECQTQNVLIEDCAIGTVHGVSDVSGIPNWIVRSTATQYDAVTTTERIKKARISSDQRIFLALIKKLFFQPGSGRMEEALIRGLGTQFDKKTVNKILNTLKSSNIVTTFPGKEGQVYSPNRKFAGRMKQIMMELTLSQDPLWVSLKKD